MHCIFRSNKFHRHNSLQHEYFVATNKSLWLSNNFSCQSFYRITENEHFHFFKSNLNSSSISLRPHQRLLDCARAALSFPFIYKLLTQDISRYPCLLAGQRSQLVFSLFQEWGRFLSFPSAFSFFFLSFFIFFFICFSQSCHSPLTELTERQKQRAA